MPESVLVEPTELADLLAADPGSVVVADVRFVLGQQSQRSAYEEAHLPGAQFVDLEAVLSAPPGPGGRHPLPPASVFESAIRGIGLRAGQLLVAYDAATSMSAARLWWLLADAGHDRVRVLSGGLAAWVAAGLPTESGPAAEVEPGDFVARPGQRGQVDAAEISAGSIGSVLVDVRTPERYAGESEPIDPIAGHIPTAVNLPAGGNQDSAGRFLPADIIRDRFAGVGENPVLYCGSGVVACQSLLALAYAGIDASLYPGSWSNWITDPARPIGSGRNP